MHTTSRLGIDVVDGTDLVSAYPAAMSQAMGILDGAVTYSEGTLASRPAAAVKGRVYKGTDTGLYYFDTGTVWDTVMLAGAWTDMTPNAGQNYAHGAVHAQVRTVGDLTEMRGSLTSTAGGAGLPFATIPVGFRPASRRGVTLTYTSLTNTPVQVAGVFIDSNGQINQNSGSAPSITGDIIYLDGVRFPV